MMPLSSFSTTRSSSALRWKKKASSSEPAAAASRDDAFFIILDGRVLLSKGGVMLAELDAGSHFGEMAMVDKAPRSASATAT